LARRLALKSQLLAPSPRLSKGAEGAARIIEHLGYVQIDTIAVVERAHHHTLWTRHPAYTPSHLHRLQAIERRVFEYWAHAASYVPIADYRFYLARMDRFRTPGGQWETDRHQACKKHFRPVLERIRAEGPLTSKDFDSPSVKGMWRHKPTTVALESLHLTGELMISERRGFERVYDLTERVLPTGIDTSRPSSEELGRFFVRRALLAYGIADEQDIVHHISGATRDDIKHALQNMVESGEIATAALESAPKQHHYLLTTTAASLARLRASARKVSLLSPFDNLIILRRRLKRLFDFDYTLECYVPSPKRVHGYFVLPILWGDSFVGRLDAKAHRSSGKLQIHRIFLEETPADPDLFLDRFAAQLTTFARFNGCHQIQIGQTTPRQFAGLLRSRLKSLYPEMPVVKK
jgi:hypothetical protein